jgi:hypothetical protein
MRSLARAARSRGTLGEAIPQPIEAIRNLGFAQRRGQTSLLVAAPGVGKSAVALYMALRCGVPTLYLSADTDKTDQSERAMALLAGVSIAEARRDPERYEHHLERIPKDCRFDFESDPTIEEIEETTKAYRMVLGYYPHLIIVDTLGRVSTGVDEETARNKEAVRLLQMMARKTGAHVLVLHHATKMFDDGATPIPLSGLMSGVTKDQEQVLCMWKGGGKTVAFCPTKNRSGKSDPTAMQLRSWCELDVDYMRISSIKPVTPNYDEDIELA